MRPINLSLSIRIVLLLLICSTPLITFAQRLEQLTNSDVNQQLSEIASLGSLLVFPAASLSSGTELYVSGGTLQSTGQSVDIAPGRASSTPHNLYPFQQGLLFVAEGELWRADSQAQGVARVISARNSAPQQSDVEILGDLGGIAVLALDDEVHGKELWTTDGTAAGTALLSDINSATESSYPAGLSNINGVGIFSAHTNTDGRELWRTDGTPAGTFMLSSINPGLADGVAWDGETTTAGYLVYFVGITDAHGAELWRTDGTTAGTVLVKDLLPGSASSYPNNLSEFKGNLYFAVGSRLFISDGTEAGTIELYNFGGSRISQIVATTENLFIAAGGMIAVSNGTALGTQIVRTNESGIEHVQGKFAALKSGVYYPGYDQVHGVELWYSDGTSLGTRLAAEVSPGISHGLRYQVVSGGRTTAKNSAVFASGGKVLFTADDGKSGPEIWIFDPVGTLNEPGISSPIPTPTTCANPSYSLVCGCLSAESDFNKNSIPDCIDQSISMASPKIKSARVKGTTLTLEPESYTAVMYEVTISKIGKRNISQVKYSGAPRVKFTKLSSGKWKVSYRIIPTPNVKSAWSPVSMIKVRKK